MTAEHLFRACGLCGCARNLHAGGDDPGDDADTGACGACQMCEQFRSHDPYAEEAEAF